MNARGHVDPPRNDSVRPILVYNARDDSLGGVDPPMNHRLPRRLV